MPDFRSTIEPVLGTRLTLRVDAASEIVAQAAEVAAISTADRLEALLSAYRPESDFNRWRSGEVVRPSVEVREVLRIAAAWFVRSGGASNPCLGKVMDAWRRAEGLDQVPDPMAVRELAAAAGELPFSITDDGEVVATGDCSVVDVHGVAKGWVIDRMVEAARAVDGVSGVMVDLGGDIRHSGDEASPSVHLAVEDPHHPLDNAPPLALVRLRDAAIATSGGGRRGWTIGGRWFGHLLDPRSGWPLPTERSATVVAGRAADADALASAFAVMDHTDAAAMARHHDVAALVATEHDGVWRSPAWERSVEELRVPDTSGAGDPDQPDGDR